MNYHEKSSVAGILTSVFVYLFFLKNLQGRLADLDAALHLQAAAKTVLIFIGISIVVRIIAEILLNILYAIVTGEGKPDPSTEDEMDKLISLKSERIAYVVASLGFLLSLVLLVMNYSPVLMVIVIYGFLNLAEVVSCVLKIVFYRRGLV